MGHQGFDSNRLLPTNANPDADSGGDLARRRAVLHGALRKCLSRADSELRGACEKGPSTLHHGGGCHGGAAHQSGREPVASRRPARGCRGVGGVTATPMRTSRFHLPVIALSIGVLLLGSCGKGSPKKTIDIALVTKALDSEWWQRVKAGAEDAARANPGVRLAVLAPEREVNIDQQVSILEDQITKGWLRWR